MLPRQHEPFYDQVPCFKLMAKFCNEHYFDCCPSPTGREGGRRVLRYYHLYTLETWYVLTFITACTHCYLSLSLLSSCTNTRRRVTSYQFFFLYVIRIIHQAIYCLFRLKKKLQLRRSVVLLLLLFNIHQKREKNREGEGRRVLPLFN